MSQICKRAGEKYILYLEYMDQNKRRILVEADDFAVLCFAKIPQKESIKSMKKI